MRFTGQTAVMLGFATALATAWAEDATWERSVQVSASIQVSQPSASPGFSSYLTLTWPQDTIAIPDNYILYRKPQGAIWWDDGTVLAGTVTSFVDSKLTEGSTCEYQIFK